MWGGICMHIYLEGVECIFYQFGGRELPDRGHSAAIIHESCSRPSQCLIDSRRRLSPCW